VPHQLLVAAAPVAEHLVDGLALRAWLRPIRPDVELPVCREVYHDTGIVRRDLVYAGYGEL
jgi:hypothetical protein